MNNIIYVCDPEIESLYQTTDRDLADTAEEQGMLVFYGTPETLTKEILGLEEEEETDFDTDDEDEDDDE